MVATTVVKTEKERKEKETKMMVNAYSQKAKREKNESYFPGMTSTNMFSRMKTTILRKELT